MLDPLNADLHVAVSPEKVFTACIFSFRPLELKSLVFGGNGSCKLSSVILLRCLFISLGLLFVCLFVSFLLLFCYEVKGKKRQAKLDCFIAALIKKYKVVRGTFFYPQVKEDCEKQQREGTARGEKVILYLTTWPWKVWVRDMRKGSHRSKGRERNHGS